MSVCSAGILQTRWFPSLIAVLAYAYISYGLLKLTISYLGEDVNYTFTDTYWVIIDYTVLPVFIIFYAILIQGEGNVPNMYPSFDALYPSSKGGTSDKVDLMAQGGGGSFAPPLPNLAP